jgi:fibronectin-binding autotransporter adhesin
MIHNEPSNSRRVLVSAVPILMATLLAGSGSLVSAQSVRTWDVASGGNGYAYELVSESLTWQAAAEKARLREPPPGFAMGNLASILSESENAFLSSWYGWIGFSDYLVEGEWRWNDGTTGVWQDPAFFSTPVQNLFTKWGAGEPNNWNGNQDYAIFNGQTWDDGSDSPIASYIVKYFPELVWSPSVGGASEWTNSLGDETWLSGATKVAWQSGNRAMFSKAGEIVSVRGIVSTGGMSFVAPGYVLRGGTLMLSGSIATLAASGSTLIESTLTGSSRLMSSGSSLLTFTGSHAYTGGTLISSGTLRLGDGSTANGSVPGNIVNNSRLEFANPTSQSYAGSISGSGAVAKIGAGTLTLTGSNSHTGTTTISQGTLVLGGSSALSQWSALMTGTQGDNARVDLAGFDSQVAGLSGFGEVSLGGARLTVSNSTSHVYAGSITGSGSLIKAGVGTLSLTGTSTFNGPTVISGGTLRLGDGVASNGAVSGEIQNNSRLEFAFPHSGVFSGQVSGTGTVLKSGSGTLVVLGEQPLVGTTTVAQGVLQFGDGVSSNGSVAGSLVANGQVGFASVLDQNYAGSISGSGSLVKTGAGVLTLTGTSVFSGVTTVSQGSLQIGDGLSQNGSLGGSIRNNATVILANVTSQTFGSVFSGSGTIVKIGAGQLTITGSQSFVGEVVINEGTLRLGNGTSLNAAITSNVTNNATLAFANPLNQVYSGTISGDGSLLKSGAGTLVFTRSQPFTGITTVSAGTLQLGDASAPSVTLNGDVNLSASSATLAFSNLANQSFVNEVSGIGGLSKSGSGTLTLLGVNAYSGPTTIGEGILRLGSGGALPSSSRLVLSSTGSAMFDINNQLQRVGSLSGGSRSEIALKAGRLTVSQTTPGTFGGVISGAGGSLVKVGSQTLTLTNINTYSGLTTVSEGVLRLGNGISVGSVAGDLVVDAEVVFANPSAQTYARTVSGTGVLTKASEGTLILTASSSFSGTTRINEGTLQLGSEAGQGSLRGTIVNNSVVIANTRTVQVLEPFMTGPGSFVKTGPGVLVVAGLNTLTGPTTIQQGTLQLAHSSALPASTISPLPGGVLSLTPNLQTTVGGLNPNAGGLVDVRTGMVTVANGLTPTALVTALQSGRAGGSWGGSSGITSSAAASSNGTRSVGWLDNGNGSMTFAYAAPGDSNLDWTVDILDAGNFLSFGKFDTGLPATWIEGDFNYDATVDILDAADFFSTSLYDAGSYNSPAGTIAAVPEPSTLGLVGVGVAGLIVARRKRAG